MVLCELWKPPPEKLNTYFILGEIVFNVNTLAEVHPNIDTDMLRALCDGIRDDQVETEDAIRALCQIFRDTYSFDFALEQLKSKTRGQVSAFIDGKAASEVVETGFDIASPLHTQHSQRAAEHVQETDKQKCEDASSSLNPAHHKLHLVDKAKAEWSKDPVIYEDVEEHKVMNVYSQVPFSNWALNVHNTPALTFIPTTVLGIQNLVRTFKGRRIRCSGYRHSRAPVFADDGDILVSILPLRQVASMPGSAILFPDAKHACDNELRTVQVFPAGKEMMHVRVGSAVTSGELRQWAVKDGWALPTNISMAEITIGGLISSICRGSGWSHKAINDQVRSIEYIDVNGRLQVVSDQNELHAAAGCFGLLGIVTHVTFEVNKATYAVMKPRKVPTMLAVPPLKPSEVPEGLQLDVTAEQLEKAVADFERRAESSEYAEWAWFPYQSDVRVNTWNSVAEKDDAVENKPLATTFLQWLSGWLAAIITSTDFYADIPCRWQAQLLATTAMAVTPPMTGDPPDLTMKTPVPNAHHSGSDFQYLNVNTMEMDVPIPALQDDASKPDWSIARKVWWEIIHIIYASVDSPMRLTLEMRIMADSNIIMAAQRGNTLGTVLIDVGTVPNTAIDEDWGLFCQKVCDKLRTFAPDGRARPHWGKRWFELQMDGMSSRQWFKTVAYKSEITEFKEVLARIGKRQGWELKDLQRQFSNHVWDEIFFDA